MERLLAILWEGPDEVIKADVGFRSIEGRDFNKYILSVDWYFGVVRVDDRWYWADSVRWIHNQRVDRALPNQMQVLLEFVIL